MADNKGIDNVLSRTEQQGNTEKSGQGISNQSDREGVHRGDLFEGEPGRSGEIINNSREMGSRESSQDQRIDGNTGNKEEVNHDARRAGNDRDGVLDTTQDSRVVDSGANSIGSLNAVGDSSKSSRVLKDYWTDQEFKVGSLRNKFDLNINALNIVLNKDAHEMSDSDRNAIAHYSGWGGLPQVFDKRNENWAESYELLKETLSDDDYRIARSSVIDSFYTPLNIRTAMWDGLARMGLNQDNEEKLILEPAVGTGNFLANNPSEANKFTTVELDNLSHKIVSALYPNQTHFHRGFETIAFMPEYDAVISNPPFSSQKMPDNNPELNGLSLHNYFIAKGQDSLADKGISAYVVSSTFLDGEDTRTRELIDKDSSFIGAVRLPNTAFSNAHTRVMTDIVFFQKGKNIDQSLNWVNTLPQEDSKRSMYSINEYFVNNPQNVLGDLEVKSGRFGPSLVCVNNDVEDLNNRLSSFIQSLPQNIYEKTRNDLSKISNENSVLVSVNDDHPIHRVKDNQFFLIDDEIYYRIGVEHSSKGEFLRAVKHQEKNNAEPDRIKRFIVLRDKINELYAIQKNELATEEEVENVRAELNDLYDLHITNNKDLQVLNRRTFITANIKDADLGKVLALEKNVVDAISKKEAEKLGVEPREISAEKADIFFRRTVRKQKNVEVNNINEALIASYNEFGKPNLLWIAEKLEITEDKAKEELLTNNLIFIDHVSGDPVSPENYLSGNVVKKLNEAKEKAFSDPSFRKNVNALQEVQPERIKASDIGIDISSSWLPKKYVSDFLEQLLDTDKFVLYKDEEFGNYDIEISSNRLTYDVRQKVETKKCDASRLLSSLFSNSPVKITKNALDEDGNIRYSEKNNPLREDDEEAISQVRSLQNLIKREFQDWVWKDPERRNDIEDVYNTTFNTNVAPSYDGSHLSLPGLSDKYQLRKHQKDAVWRGLQEGGGLLDHVVGAGKTLASISIAIESKRMGLFNKPMVTVPNHLVYQWRDSIYDAYPEANVLVPTAEDMSTTGRETFYGKIASNDWDLVIIPHSQFDLLPSPPEAEKEIAQKEIEAILRTRDKIGSDTSKSVKTLQRKIDSREQKLAELLTRHNNSKSMDFSDLGVDALIVDEAHEFKNLSFVTEKEGVLGLGKPDGSKRAQSLFTKVRWLQQNNDGKGVFFLTGTPISNSIAEMYTMQRYMQYDLLVEKGIDKFDSWASSFGEVGHTWELDSSGTRYKLVSRFNKFKNVPELLSLYGGFADVVDNNEIAKFNGNLIPSSRGGKPLNIVVPRTENVANYIGIQDSITGEYSKNSVIWRMDNSHLDKVNNNMLACTNDARKAGLDYRLIDPTAEDTPLSKINALVDHVHAEYALFNEYKGAQLVFCDMSVAKRKSQNIDVNEITDQSSEDDLSVSLEDMTEEQLSRLSADDKLAILSQFDAYSDILKKLVNRGIPQNEIRFIHDCTTDAQRAKLFKEVNDGDVRVLIGSTGKMGAGMNVQKRLTAMHHLDCPWRPSDIEQRNGRAYRQGNYFHNNPEKFPNFGILEVRYSTQNTYDARMWEINEQKALAIEQLKVAGKKSAREMDDVISASSNAAEMKAVATGNPLMKMQQEIKQLLRVQEVQYSHFLKQEHEHQNIYNHLKNLKLPYVRRDAYSQMIQERQGKETIEVEVQREDKVFVENEEIKSYLMDGNKIVLNPKDKDLPEIRKEFHLDIQRKIENLQQDGVQIEILEHRGLRLVLDKTITPISLSKDEVLYNFEVQDRFGNSFGPRNLEIRGAEINGQSSINISGLMTRLTNAIDGLDLALELSEKDIVEREAKLAFYEKRKVGVYEDMDLLFALRKDSEDILTVIKNQSKDEEKANNYVPTYRLLDGSVTKEEVIEEKTTNATIYFPEIARRYELINNRQDNFYELGDRLFQEEIIQEVPADLSATNQEEIIQEVPADLSATNQEEIIQEVPADLSATNQEEIIQEVPADLSATNQEEIIQEVPADLSATNQEEIIQEVPADLSATNQEEIIQEVPADLFATNQEEIIQEVPADLSATNQEEIIQEVPADLSMSTQEKIIQAIQDKIDNQAMPSEMVNFTRYIQTVISEIPDITSVELAKYYDMYLENNVLSSEQNREIASEFLSLTSSLKTMPPFNLVIQDHGINIKELSNESLYVRLDSFSHKVSQDMSIALREYEYCSDLIKEIESRSEFFSEIINDDKGREELDKLHSYSIYSYRVYCGADNKNEPAHLNQNQSYANSIVQKVEDLEIELGKKESNIWASEIKGFSTAREVLNLTKDAYPYTNPVKVEKIVNLSQKLANEEIVVADASNYDQKMLSNNLKDFIKETYHIYKVLLAKTPDEIIDEISFKQEMDSKFTKEIEKIDEFVNGNVIDLTSVTFSPKVLDNLYVFQDEIREKLKGSEYLSEKEELIIKQQKKVESMMNVDLSKQKDFYFISTADEKNKYLSPFRDELNTSTINLKQCLDKQLHTLKMVDKFLEDSKKLRGKVSDDPYTNEALGKEFEEIKKLGSMYSTRLEKGIQEINYWNDKNKPLAVLDSCIDLQEKIVSERLKVLDSEDYVSAIAREEKKPIKKDLFESLSDIHQHVNNVEEQDKKIGESLDIFDIWDDNPKVRVDLDLPLKESISNLLGFEKSELFIKKMDEVIPGNIYDLKEAKREEFQRNGLISFFKENNLTQGDNEALTLSYIEYTKHRYGTPDRVSVPRLMQYDFQNLEKNMIFAKNDVENFYNSKYENMTVTEDPRKTKTDILNNRYENLFKNFKNKRDLNKREVPLEKHKDQVKAKERSKGMSR